jgi:hypothetical protein
MSNPERIILLEDASPAQLRALACQNGIENWKTAKLVDLCRQLNNMDELVHERTEQV